MSSIEELRLKYGNEVAGLVFICRVYTGTSTKQELSAYFSQYEHDFVLLYKLIRTHQIRPVALRVLSDMAIENEIKCKLQEDCREIAIKNFENAKELIRLYQVFKQAGIIVIPYKGVVYSERYYKETGMREFCDIDFLVLPKDIGALKNILGSLGYVEELHSIPEIY